MSVLLMVVNSATTSVCFLPTRDRPSMVTRRMPGSTRPDAAADPRSPTFDTTMPPPASQAT